MFDNKQATIEEKRRGEYPGTYHLGVLITIFPLKSEWKQLFVAE